jgi:NAD(P)-dependent dehydrogenase (short-subunit alcohol dehydrogenase family)
MNVLAGKVAIVTGASSGIGRATALLFALEGAKLVVTARRRSQLDELVDEIKESAGEALAVAGDVRDETLAKELVDTAVRGFGGLDVAFNNAGSLGEMAPTPQLSLAGWRDTLDINLTSAFLGAKHALKRMAKPEEIARSVLHLASDASSFITGTALLVDGGVSISRSNGAVS